MKESKDILVTFENLNNHEVFTPPRVSRDMLNLLPKEIWSDPNIKLLDPCVKTGVFLRESFYLFFKGLESKGIYLAHDGIEYDLDNQQDRINHILKNMLYGIATSELTGYISRRTLYGVMRANSDKTDNALDSVRKLKDLDSWDIYKQDKFIENMTVNDYFDFNIFSEDENYKDFQEEGNIFYPTDEVQLLVMEEDDYEIEDTYYPFLEKDVKHKKIKEIKERKMTFDVIIGNPPYQMSDGGGNNKSSAIPIYHKFIEQAICMKPKYISMIVPSRWMTGGRGLDSFRKNMLNDNKFKFIYDFKDASNCFPNVDIGGGINYFLWQNSYEGKCNYIQMNNTDEISQKLRQLNEFDIFIRDNMSLSILYKTNPNSDKKTIKDYTSTRRPFNLSKNNKQEEKFIDYEIDSFEESVKLYGNKLSLKKDSNILDGIAYVKKEYINKNVDKINKHKVIIPKTGDTNGAVLFKPIYSEPNSVCSQTYIILGYFNIKIEALNLIKYVKTKFFRFMVSLRKNTHNSTKDVYGFVPALDMTQEWTDEILYKKYNLTQEEIDYIESSIKEMV